MIEKEIIDYLESDSTLDILLNSSVSDTKIYPIIPRKIPTPPYILYKVGIGELDETLDEDRIQIDIAATTIELARSIRNRIKILLDKQDRIQDYILSDNNIIYYSKLTSGDEMYLSERQLWIVVMYFNIKYKSKS